LGFGSDNLICAVGRPFSSFAFLEREGPYQRRLLI
jgi:hypothetical protein